MTSIQRQSKTSMVNTKRKFAAILLALILIVPVGLLVACEKEVDPHAGGEYTYRSMESQKFPENWSTHEYTLTAGADFIYYLNTSLYESYENIDENGNPTYLPNRPDLLDYAYRPAAASAVPVDWTEQVAKRKGTSDPNYGLELNEQGKLPTGMERRAWRVPVRGDLKWETGEQLTLEDYEYSMQQLIDPNRKTYRSDLKIAGSTSIYGADKYFDGSNPNWRDVGFEVTEQIFAGDPDSTMGSLIYVFNNSQPEALDDVMVAFDSSFVVHKATYEAFNTNGGTPSTNYGTSVQSTKSFGPYKLESISATNVTFVKNEYWGKDKNGNDLYPNQYQATKISRSLVTDESSRRMRFLSGEFDEYNLTSDDNAFKGSQQRRDVLSSFSMRVFFNMDEVKLQAIEDRGVGNPQNLRYLANNNFRQGFSYAINRAAVAQGAGPSQEPSVVLWNELYWNTYDSNNREQYRYTDDALRAILRKYVDDATVNSMSTEQLRNAYNGLSGQMPNTAKAFFEEAKKEMGDEGKDITVAFSVYVATPASVALYGGAFNALQQSLNTVLQGTGMTINVRLAANTSENRYRDIENGAIEATFGALGGATSNLTNPLGNFLGIGVGGGNDGIGAGFNPESRYATINLTDVLNSSNPDVARLAKLIYDENKPNDPDTRENWLTLNYQQWAVLFRSTTKTVFNSAEIIFNPDYNPNLPNVNPEYVVLDIDEGVAWIKNPFFDKNQEEDEYGEFDPDLNQEWVYYHGEYNANYDGVKNPYFNEDEPASTNPECILSRGTEYRYDQINYNFLPSRIDGQNVSTGRSHPLVASWNRIEFYRSIIPQLEVEILNLAYAVPLYMEFTSTLISFRMQSLTLRPDPASGVTGGFAVAGLRFMKFTMSDEGWAAYIKKHSQTDLENAYKS